jgi:hypothetical protein
MWLSDAGISATTDGAVVVVRTNDSSKGTTLPRLMTVKATDSRVEDLADDALPFSSIRSSAASIDASGQNWFFAGDGNGTVIAAHGSDAGWTRAAVLPASLTGDLGADLTSANMVDDQQGFFTYSRIGDQTPHLVTWDGSCWTDQAIGKPKVESMVVAADAAKQPWVAWISTQESGADALLVRSPNGDTQDLLANVKIDARVAGKTIRLLPGGLDGTAAVPTVAARFADGIRVISSSQQSESGWLSLLLTESEPVAAGTNDCTAVGSPEFGNLDACAGVNTCSGQRSGASAGFGLVRTQSGSVFAGWVNYSGQGTFAPKAICYGSGEMGSMCYCGYTETSGTGTADLVVARITESEPIVAHFPFDMGGTAWVDSTVSMAARGDTLVVAAYLSDQTVPTLTYVEIDSKLLP